jgi:hypothetical protein
MLAANQALNLLCKAKKAGMRILMTQTDQQNDDQKLVRPADRSVWLIWLGMVLFAVAILPFAVRNSEIVRQIAAMCGFTLN